ncbi:hypothetical protein ACFXGT_37590 [Streptomyces sp. NPDC059352]|uniref:hypothetical protein n=1 Tax=Streptomyces sp. NPDC059352 TaxID=3346810 RepID=UPI003689A366
MSGLGSDGDAAARDWSRRLGWAFGLVADDPAVRAAALARLGRASRNAEDALDRWNELWQLTLPLGPQEQYQETAFRHALDVYSVACGHCLPQGLWSEHPGVDITAWRGLPYGLLFLEWEARYPREWTGHAKAWSAKESLIRKLAVPGHDETVRTKLTDLVELVVRRAYRCKDREYVRVARAVDGEDLRRRLGAAAEATDPWARVHAGYVLWLLDRPEVPNTRHVWRTWLAGDPH